MNQPLEGGLICTSRGNKLIVPSMDREVLCLYYNDLYDSFESKVLEVLLEKGATFVDVGASIGHYTLLASKAVGHSGKVIAFEPEAYSHDVLLANIALNGCENVTAVQKTVSSKSDLSSETTSLDDYFSGQSIDVVKMDTEGADLYVWKGMEELRKSNPNLIALVEFAPTLLTQAGVAPIDFLKAMKDDGFQIYMMSKDELTAHSIVEGTEKIEKIKDGFLSPLDETKFVAFSEWVTPNVINLLCGRNLARLASIRPFIP